MTSAHLSDEQRAARKAARLALIRTTILSALREADGPLTGPEITARARRAQVSWLELEPVLAALVREGVVDPVGRTKTPRGAAAIRTSYVIRRTEG